MRPCSEKYLKTTGPAQFRETAEGEEAVRLYKNYKPDLVMDVTTPGMDGITALKKIIGFDFQARVVICGSRGGEGRSSWKPSSPAPGIIIKPSGEKLKEII